MRIPKSWVPLLARRIVGNIISKGLLRPTVPLDIFISETKELILSELTVEDRLNEEVREILKKYSTEIEKGHLDYRKLFELTKQKLVKERDLVL